MLIVCDFDGTVTARDTNSHLATVFAPSVYAQLEGRLARRELTVRDVLAAEFSEIRAPLDELVAVALEVPIRAGFRELVDRARERGGDVVLLSSGFRQLIEPVLERHQLLHDVHLLANDIEGDPGGCRITWRDLPTCSRCGEACKRHDVEQLRAGTLHEGRRFERVVFVGDGFSDRCGAEAADRVFARDSLATWLDSKDEPWEPWDDFSDVLAALHAEWGKP